MATYEIEIYSLDVTSGTFSRIDKITTFQNLQFFNRLNGIGGARFELNVFDPKATQANLKRFANQIAIKRNGTVVFFGPITNRPWSFENVKGVVAVEAQTYLHHLKSRFTDKLTTYTNTEQTTIAWNLINLVQTRTNGNLGIVQGAAPSSVTRDRTYEYKSIADALMQLTEVIAGFDFSFDPIVNTTTNLVTGVTFNCYYPRLGSNRTDLNKLRVGQNIKSIECRSINEIMNSGISEGSGTGSTGIISTLDYDSSQTAYTRREVVYQQKDVSVQSTLNQNLTALLNETSVEMLGFNIELYPDKLPLIDQYILGDTLYLDIFLENDEGVRPDFTTYQGQARVIEQAVAVDSVGRESITPKLLVLN